MTALAEGLAGGETENSITVRKLIQLLQSKHLQRLMKEEDHKPSAEVGVQQVSKKTEEILEWKDEN